MGFDTLRVKVQIDLESLCGGIMLGCMNEKDFINLIHDVKRHEDAVTEDAKEIRELKVDVWELSKSREAPRCFCAEAGFWNGGGKSGNRIRNAATGGTSETWDREMNTFGRWDKILLPRTPHVHPCALCQTILKKRKSRRYRILV